MKVGRKPKLTQQLIIQAERLTLDGNYDNVICGALGISTETWYRWLRDGEALVKGEETSIPYTPEMQSLLSEFYDTIKKAQTTAQAQMVNEMRQYTRINWQALGWFMERRWPEQWGRKQVIAIDPKAEESYKALDRFLERLDEETRLTGSEEYIDPLDDM